MSWLGCEQEVFLRELNQDYDTLARLAVLFEYCECVSSRPNALFEFASIFVKRFRFKQITLQLSEREKSLLKMEKIRGSLTSSSYPSEWGHHEYVDEKLPYKQAGFCFSWEYSRGNVAVLVTFPMT
ncbi:hypothetical protein AVEN_59748-1 [Araneus ventricosus]|uniref:Uncharacterized protein n=1 Tax=Araneus ventricosus TaxID=182803 RepID=A0A4Y2BMZ3_ARAVE|nr:hypothetical protein AVEN_59748-1 [Araneus ventricosus]